ncbi:MAG: DUF2232 domain-containing protein [Gemmatimonadaceae bacterium]|nr:DUF2232 domain-containing protein [Gemmatimonadaceae bacterium]
MDAAVTTKPVGQSWRLLAFALAAFILLPLWPSQLQVVVPILQTSLLLAPIIAVCAVIGWLAGSRPYLAIVWVALAIWLLIAPMGRGGSPYDGMARGWALLLAGCFGLMCLWSSAIPFIVRALGALGLAIAAAFVVAVSSPGGVDRYVKVSASEFSARSAAVIAAFEMERRTPFYRGYAAKLPEMHAFYDDMETTVREAPARSAVLLPALLALQSLGALALGWAVYSRLAPNSIGPALSPLKEFRFSDQLVWGVAVGGTLLMLPAFEEGRGAGLNLLVFFGALYLIRGMGVVAWMSRRRGLLIASVLVVLFVPPVFKLIVAALIGIGLGDTWLDWRSRPRVA